MSLSTPRTLTFAARVSSLVALAAPVTGLALESAAHAQECPAGLAGWWTFDDGTARDSAGANDGSVNGAVAVGDGLLGGAFSFDGGASIDVPPSPALEPQSFTLEAWIRGDTWSCPFGFCTVLASGDSDGTPSGYYIVVHPDGRVRVTLGYGTAPVNEINAITAASAAPGEWTHVAATHDASALRIFLNGVEQGSRSSVGDIFYEGLPLQIGAGVARFFRGAIDEVAVHARALSAAELRQHYLNGLAGKDYCAPPDFDGDGVADDGADLCPDTPADEVAQVDAAGCGPSQRDTDGDSLADSADMCIDSPAADRAFIASALAHLGCGAAAVCGGAGGGGSSDPDGDGFDYGADLCPWTDRAGGPASPVIDGCSCGQLLRLKPGNNHGELRKGCTPATLKAFERRSGWARNLPRPPG